MYNRYIPQPDGSYRRNRVPDQNQHHRPQPVPPPPPPPKPAPTQPQDTPCHPEPKHPPKKPPCRQDSSVTGFLRQLLPKDFDTGDLIVVLLLLLMAGDCEEDRNHALLTLALYFFM